MFKITKKFRKNNLRLGKIITKNGVIETPFFMPDATRGYIKSLSKKDLDAVGMGPMVVNTYHLYLQPGMKIIKKAGGIHGFMNWDKPLLSDSGGYQVFSLVHKNSKMGKITDNEVIFRSPLDGSLHSITPEKSIQIQFDLGVNMMVCFDDPPPNNSDKKMIKAAVERTIRWAERCMIEYKRQLKLRKIKKKDRPLIFCVIQGGPYIDLREYCTKKLIEIGFSAKGGPAFGWDGYGFGARHVDEKGNFMAEILEKTASFIPEESLRFALGVGNPNDIVKCASYGWDMFDCVIPTREARHGRIFLWQGKGDIKKKNFYKTVNIKNAKFKGSLGPIDKNCNCELCKNHSSGYLSHLFKMNETLGQRLVSIHNLKFYLDLIKKIKYNK